VLTLTEAAKATGLTRPGLLKAIQTGRLSASKNDLGQWRIDPAELFRVYEPVNAETNENQPETKREFIAKELALTKRLLAQVEAERDHLRQSLTQALTMLTHQPETTRTDAPETHDRLLKKLFRGKGY
jgi:uncharacterized protein YicC (UPF0701 family)